MQQKDINTLVNFAIQSLDNMWCPEQLLFTHRSVPGENINVKQKTNTRYTAMCLIGLKQAEKEGLKLSIPLGRIADKYFSMVDQLNEDELGLLLWTNVYYEKIPVGSLFERIRNNQDYFFGKYTVVMSLAWLLTGLVLTYEKEKNPEVSDMALKLKNHMLSLQNPQTGLFRTTKFVISRSMLHNIRSHKLGSFAAQIYPVYALAEYYRVFKDDTALNGALNCAGRLTRLQGDQGQWWWIYHVDDGSVVEKYPVYSVHQDGMAPMALDRLQKVSDKSFEKAIYKGLDWIYGANELSVSMMDETDKLIWRAIKRKEGGRSYSFGMGYSGHLNATAGALTGGRQFQWLFDRVKGFEVLKECRSYHLGWILNAFADRYN